MTIAQLKGFELEVAKKLLASGGAHKPTHYQFGPNKYLIKDLA